MYEPAGVTAMRCRFDGNDSGNHGGGVCCFGPSRFEDCTFIGNNGYSGGGFFHCAREGPSSFAAPSFETTAISGAPG